MAIWISIVHLFCMFKTFHNIILGIIKKMSKTWISLLALMHMASKDPRPLSLATFSASFLPAPHLTLHAVATRTFSYFLKPIMYHLGPRDLCIFPSLKTPLPFFFLDNVSDLNSSSLFPGTFSLCHLPPLT